MRAASQQDLRGSAAERQRREDGLQDEHRAARGADVDLMMARAQRSRGEGEHRGGDRGPSIRAPQIAAAAWTAATCWARSPGLLRRTRTLRMMMGEAVGMASVSELRTT